MLKLFLTIDIIPFTMWTDIKIIDSKENYNIKALYVTMYKLGSCRLEKIYRWKKYKDKKREKERDRKRQ